MSIQIANTGRGGIDMPPKGFICKQCGNCCLNLYDAFTTSVTDEDIHLWESKGRDDILDWVAPIPLGENQFVFDIWISPTTGEDVTRCPWLRKLPNRERHICRIHDVKPKHCRDYPKSRKHAEETGCRGFE